MRAPRSDLKNKRRPAERTNTRERLLEAAGRVFAEKGFDAATGKDICGLAGANPAAVVYHFGSMDRLYAAVLASALNRLVSTDMFEAVATGSSDPKAKIASIIGSLVTARAGPDSRSWPARVVVREIISPSRGLREFADEELEKRTRILKALVGELTGLSADDAEVSRGVASLLAPCLWLLSVDQKRLERFLPGLNLQSNSQDDLACFVSEYVLGGLAAIAREPQGSRTRRKPMAMPPQSI